MLYRQPSFSLIAILRAALVRVAGFVAELYRINADTTYIDGLDEAALRELGIQRIEARDERFYR